MSATMVVFEGKDPIDADKVESVLIERMMTVRPVGGGRGLRALPVSEPECWKLNISASGRTHEIAKSLKIEDALLLKDKVIAALQSGGVVSPDAIARGMEVEAA